MTGVIYPNLIREYEFSWTIEEFSSSPDVLRGPSFSSIPGLQENLCIELHYKERICWSSTEHRTHEFTEVEISLVDMNFKNCHTTVVSSCISLCHTNGNILRKVINASRSFQGNIVLMHLSDFCLNKLQFSNKMELLDDKLVVKGKLTIYSNDVARRLMTAASSLIVYEELSNDFKKVYESGSSSDITFSVGEETLRAHKNILVSRSPVFAKMFDSDMLESNSKKVVIEDTDFHAFNCFLTFLYTGVVEDKQCDTVLSLYSLAHKYQVMSLHVICSGILSQNPTINSACKILVLSDLHGDKELTDALKVFIRCHLGEIAGTTEWAEIVLNKPLLVKEVLSAMAYQTTK